MTLIDEDYIPETGALFNFGEIGIEGLEPKLWIRNDPIIDLSCGDEFVVIITASGRAFSYGKNDWGQLGLSDTKTVLIPSCIKELKAINERAVHVACGRYHTIISTESNKLFGFGSNSDGQLGLDKNTGLVSTPTHIKNWNFGPIKQLAAGGAFTAVINDKGSLYTWGSNSEFQLGIGDTSNESKNIPTEITFFSTPVSFVSCGSYHAAAINQGILYLWGEATDYKLGQRYNENQSSPQKVLMKSKTKQVSCGHNHTICLTESGDVYVWGNGDSGQLGLGPYDLLSTLPTLLKVPNLTIKNNEYSTEALEKFSVISAGESHSVIISTTGISFSFGNGRHGKLGNAGDAKNYSNYMCPKPIEKLNSDLWIENVKCGGCHTVVLVRNRNQHEKIEIQQKFNSSMESLNPSMFLSSTMSDLNSSSLRARKKRRQNNKILESTLPTLSQTMPTRSNTNNINSVEKMGNSSVDEIEGKIIVKEKRTVQSILNGVLTDSSEPINKKPENEIVKSSQSISDEKRRSSFNDKVDNFVKLLDEAYYKQNKEVTIDKTKKSDEISNFNQEEIGNKKHENHDIKSESEDVKISVDNQANKTETTNIGCIGKCKRKQNSVNDTSDEAVSKGKNQEMEKVSTEETLKPNQESKSCNML